MPIKLGSASSENEIISQEKAYEQTHFSASQDQTQAHQWFFGALPHQERPSRHSPPSPEGAQEIRLLDWPKGRRLLKSRCFGVCYDHGRKLYTRRFVLFVLRREDDVAGFRLGLTVSRKVGSSVVRNRVRRVVREFFRLHQAMIEQALDIVVVPKRSLDPKSIDMALVEQEFLPVLSRLAREGAGGTADTRSPC